jgi:hypothetical protein
MIPLMISTLAEAATPDARRTPSFAERDGTAEALADLSAGRPIKFYSHVFNGRVPGFRTPGLTYCSPDWADPRSFTPLPAADWAEGETYSARREEEAGAAMRFAKAYNLTIFERRKADVVRLCPRVQLEPKGS